jgi:hypothetical protein
VSSSARLRLSSLDAGLRRAHLAARLRAAPAYELLPELAQILDQGNHGSTEARTALLDLAEVLGSNGALRAKVADAATERDMTSLMRWLSAQVDVSARRAEPTLRNGHGRLLTLGEKKTLARLAPAELLPKLLLDVETPVVARALAHPRLTEDILVSVMAKRPGSQLLLTEASKHPKWVQRARVRVALLAHPDTPTARALLVVPLLLRQELELVMSLPRIAPEVREASRARLASLPPFDAPPGADA